MFTIETADDRIDQPVKIMLNELPPKSQVTLNLHTIDTRGMAWSSMAVFEAQENGVVDVSTQAPLRGTYSGVDSMGLIWSMRPKQNGPVTSFYIPDLEKPMEFTLSALSKGKCIAEKKIIRKLWSPSIEKYDINEPDVKGCCFVPAGNTRLPAVLLCAGSGGGIASQLPTAALLASHGYVTFVMAYFNYPGLPQTLYETPLEMFQKGVEWLRQHSRVDRNRVALFGVSKGAEGILAAASHLPISVQGLIAISPSNVVWQGIGRGKPENRSSWTLNGKPLPFVKMASKKILPQFMRASLVRTLRLQNAFPASTRLRLLPVYNGYRNADSNQVIPTENIQAPLLLISGDRDKTWPSSAMSRAVVERRRQYKTQFSDENLHYSNAGHVIQFPYQPTTVSYLAFPKLTLDFGGNPPGSAHANENSWGCVLRFLRKVFIS